MISDDLVEKDHSENRLKERYIQDNEFGESKENKPLIVKKKKKLLKKRKR